MFNEIQKYRIELYSYQRTGSINSITGFPVNGHVTFKMLIWVLVMTMSSCSSPGIGWPAWWTFCRKQHKTSEDKTFCKITQTYHFCSQIHILAIVIIWEQLANAESTFRMHNPEDHQMTISMLLCNTYPDSLPELPKEWVVLLWCWWRSLNLANLHLDQCFEIRWLRVETESKQQGQEESDIITPISKALNRFHPDGRQHPTWSDGWYTPGTALIAWAMAAQSSYEATISRTISSSFFTWNEKCPCRWAC